MKKTLFPAITTVAVSLVVLGGMALAAQDRRTLKVPNGPAFSEFKGYEDWQYVAVSQTETGVKVIAANPVMIKAYRSEIPGNGKPFPEGSQIAKIEWKSTKSAESPYFVMVPETLKSLSFIEKDFQEIQGFGRMGIRSVSKRCSVRHVDALRGRRRVRLCMPYGGEGKRLHFHGLSPAMNGKGVASRTRSS